MNVRLAHGQDPREIQAEVAAWRDAGADVCIVYLNTPHDASVMEPLAAVLAEVG